MDQLIYFSIFLASLATYSCRAFGVKLSNRVKIKSNFFDWIECISIGIIVSVITKIIFFQEGMLEQTLLSTRIISIIVLLIIYFSIKKNIILAIVVATTLFILLNNIEFKLFYF